MAAQLKVMGIYREEKFSNRAVEADRAIMDEVLNVLKQGLGKNVTITCMRPEDMAQKSSLRECDLVFSMAQEERVLAYLEHLEKNGAVVVNSSRAIRNCFREKLSDLLHREEFSYPSFVALNVETALAAKAVLQIEMTNGIWIKRGDYHAVVDEDVVYVDSAFSLRKALLDFQGRGVSKVVLQKNCSGELYKFYGVRDNFFSLRYMGKTSNNRYTARPEKSDVIFDRARLEMLAHQAAKSLDLDYFGGDCIVTETGKIHFIDFNDWPSFRTCRKEVAPTMVAHALKKIKNEVDIACHFPQ